MCILYLPVEVTLSSCRVFAMRLPYEVVQTNCFCGSFSVCVFFNIKFVYMNHRNDLEWRLNPTFVNCDKHLGPVVKNIVSLTTSLGRQLVMYMRTKLSNTPLFFVENAKDSHIFPTKIMVYL